MKKNKIVASGALLLLAGAAVTFFYLRRKHQFAPLSTAQVDLDRYLGKWYDIAHLPAVFLKGCFNTQAEYTKNEDGTIKVVNTCNKGSVHGEEDTAEGKATVVDKVKNSKLKVEFLWPFKGDYWILEVGENYDYALVGEPSRQYLWILGRKSHLDESILSKLIARANEEGFATNNLEMTRHHL